MHVLMTSVLVLVLAQETNQAERTFRASEKKLAEAKTVQVVFHITLNTSKGKLESKGTLDMAKGNKLRGELSDERGEKPVKMTILSDGRKTETKVWDSVQKPEVYDTPKNANALMVALIIRAGINTGFSYLTINPDGEEPPRLEDVISTVSDFSVGAKEKI